MYSDAYKLRGFTDGYSRGKRFPDFAKISRNVPIQLCFKTVIIRRDASKVYILY